MRYIDSAAQLDVFLSDEVNAWIESEQVEIYATIDAGSHGALDLLVEKDYVCLDLNDPDNRDTFPNPDICAVSQRMAGRNTE